MLAGQDLQKPAEWADRKSNNAFSQLQDIVAKIEATKQTLAARLYNLILEVQSVDLIILAAMYSIALVAKWEWEIFFIESSYMVSKKNLHVSLVVPFEVKLCNECFVTIFTLKGFD